MMTEQYTELYPVEVSQIILAGEIIYDRENRGKSYFYLTLETTEE